MIYDSEVRTHVYGTQEVIISCLISQLTTQLPCFTFWDWFGLFGLFALRLGLGEGSVPRDLGSDIFEDYLEHKFKWKDSFKRKNL